MRRSGSRSRIFLQIGDQNSKPYVFDRKYLFCLVVFGVELNNPSRYLTVLADWQDRFPFRGAVDLSNAFTLRTAMTEYLFKVLVVGNGRVGKSSFVHRYVNGKFSKEYKMTMGGKSYVLTWLRQIMIWWLVVTWYNWHPMVGFSVCSVLSLSPSLSATSL